MQKLLATLSTTAALSFSAFALADGGNVHRINSSIHIEAGQNAGDLHAVNGSVDVAGSAHAQSVSTVNGDVDLGARASAESIKTVNGGIELDDGAHVARNAQSVNGSIRLGKGAEVAGMTSNVNGHIALTAAHVGGGIQTVAGDIDVGADSRVEGGILVDQPHGHSNDTHIPRIVIGPRAVVDGTLEFRREVELFVSKSAKVGAIQGATAKTFDGDKP